jgi:hypothetical protein
MHDPFFIRSSTFSRNQLSLKLPFICRSEQSINFWGVCHLANVPFGECTIWRMNHLMNVPFGYYIKIKINVFGPITQL